MLLSASTAFEEKAVVQMDLLNDELPGFIRLSSEAKQCRTLKKTAQSSVINTIAQNLRVENMDEPVNIKCQE